MTDLDISKINFEELIIKDLTDNQLYRLAQECGKRSKIWGRRFAVLLVEIARRSLHRSYNFESIYEFAAKVGGMGKNVVYEILLVAKHLHDKPQLWKEFKKSGWSKVRVVMGVATKETDSYWAEKVKRLTKKSLEVFVKGVKVRDSSDNSLFTFLPKNPENNTNMGLNKTKMQVVPNFGEDFSAPQEVKNCVQKYSKMRFKATKETEFQFQKFKQETCKEQKEALTSGEILSILLKRSEELELLVNGIRKKRLSGPSGPSGSSGPTDSSGSANIVSRNIPQHIKDQLVKKFAGRCAFPNCNRPYEEFNHIERFAITKRHKNIYPLCKIHHELSHAGCIVNEEMEPNHWRLGEAKKSKKVQQIDKKAREYKGLK